MNNKKKIILIVVAIILTLGIIAGALALYFTRYNSDDADTEEFFRQNVASVNYENTIETAYPQTARKAPSVRRPVSGRTPFWCSNPHTRR